ncbi:MAG: hypothetical protein K0S21_80 [Rhizobiaceae bacterium]|jgi:hypothetical protein|nr:hypothetical protein [Rhizobiaceae bacterium]
MPWHHKTACSVATTVALVTATAMADAGSRDRLYADSFGNLIVDSGAGYKRIVVGKGHLAQQLSRYGQGGDEDVVILDESDDDRILTWCYRPPVFVKGRSYMYGLADGEMPDLWGGCR